MGGLLEILGGRLWVSAAVGRGSHGAGVAKARGADFAASLRATSREAAPAAGPGLALQKVYPFRSFGLESDTVNALRCHLVAAARPAPFY